MQHLAMAQALPQTPSWPGFDEAVVDRGYRWWYLDASAADGQHHLVVIAFVGSVFSPFYARACDRGDAVAADYCAFNVGLYGPSSRHTWVFTEFESAAVARTADTFELGRNRLAWDGQTLTIDVDDRSAPLHGVVRGQIRVTPQALTGAPFRFGNLERHGWWPIAPKCGVTVSVASPGIAWHGSGYLDMNFGDEPLHEGFDDWQWCRWHDADTAAIQYHARHRGGGETALALTIANSGDVAHGTLPAVATLSRTLWGIDRAWYSDDASASVSTIDDTPFYARSLVHRTHPPGASPLMHESLSLHRFRRAWVRRLLPFRMRFPLGRLFS
ncbi:MAG: carotenoid 1,2-hydratase [Pseudomonadota bacterium]